MAESPKIYTPAEANQVIRLLQEVLPELRRIRDQIYAERDQCDVEEITSLGSKGPSAVKTRERMNQHHTKIKELEALFEKRLSIFDELGCDLKALEPGLVDFYTRIDGKLAYLCWQEGETEIKYWHTLEGGFAGREPLE